MTKTICRAAFTMLVLPATAGPFAQGPDTPAFEVASVRLWRRTRAGCS